MDQEDNETVNCNNDQGDERKKYNQWGRKNCVSVVSFSLITLNIFDTAFVTSYEMRHVNPHMNICKIRIVLSCLVARAVHLWGKKNEFNYINGVT